MDNETLLVHEARKAEVAALAAGVDAAPLDIVYSEDEHRTWVMASNALRSRWRGLAAPEIVAADERLGLPSTRLPQLREVTTALRPRTGFVFRAVPGLVPVAEFFGALADGCFLSTQYVRHHSSPLYTPEPDVVHEVLGHATCLSQPHLSMLHRAAGSAMQRVESPAARRFIADVFWFSAEFGVIEKTGQVRAYGAGILSSVEELDHMRRAVIRPLDVAAMGTQPYRIDALQPVLFAARSLAEVVDVVGEFFATATDDSVAALRASTELS